MRTNRTKQSSWQKFVSLVTIVVTSAIMACALAGCSDSDSAANNAPTTVTSTVIDSGTTTVSWSAVTGATSYNIYYATTPTFTPSAANKVATVTGITYTCTGLDYLYNYYFKVSANFANGEGTCSSPCECILPPVAPAGVSAKAGSSAGVPFIDVSWIPVSSSASYPITYNIYKATTTPVPLTTPFVANALAPYQDSAVLADGTQYYYAVTSKGPGGESKASSEASTSAVIAPAAPQGVSVIRTPEVTLSATLTWAAPSSGVPDTFEIYRSTTAGSAFAPANFVASVPVGTYQYIDNSGLLGNTTYYWAVSAKNLGGENASNEVSLKVVGSSSGGDTAAYGNNFSAALIFADDIGISNLPITGTWTGDMLPFAGIDYNTGLRPLATEVAAFPVTQLTLPYLFVPYVADPLYFEQKTGNTWQGEWAKGKAEPQNVTAKWGDNLAGGSASLSSTSKIRVEMVLTKALTTPMKAYTMKALYGAQTSEMQGTNGVTYDAITAFVMATNARLKIEKLDAADVPVSVLTDQALFDPAIADGLNKLAGEIPVSGNFTYGFVWDPQALGATAGKYRLTFILDAFSAFGGTGLPATAPAAPIANNTFITTATNGVLDSATQVHLDVTLK
ncbi:MAG: fibronectin type III domain-containing protein [Geobacteraceae bacterium]|nr:fibronectin type III domain-containing protein [Geobacteraceae bacterium]